MKRKNSYKVEEDEFEVLVPELEEEFVDLSISDYVAVRRLSYEIVNPPIKVAVGALVPQQIINDIVVFENLLSKGAIKKGGR